MRTRHLLSSLPLLVAALSDRFGIRVEFGPAEAWTNSRVIRIPALPLGSNAEVLAHVRGHIDLQAAHIMHTDFRAMADATSRLDNVALLLFRLIEDWRVGTRMVQHYPGTGLNLDWLIRKQCDSWAALEAPRADPANAVLQYLRYTVLAWLAPDVLEHRAKSEAVVQMAFPGLLAELGPILAEVRTHCPDTQASIAHAERLALCLRSHAGPVAGQPGALPPLDLGTDEDDGECGGDGIDAGLADAQEGVSGDAPLPGPDDWNAQDGQECPGQDGSGHEDDDASGLEGLEAGAGLGAGRGDPPFGGMELPDFPPDGADFGGTPDSEGSVPPCGDGDGAGHGYRQEEQHQMLESLFERPARFLPEDLSQSLANRLAQEQCWISSNGFVAPKVGKVKMQPLGKNACERALKSSSALRARLQGLLQADSMRRCAIGRRGRLHTKSLYRTAVANPRIFLKEMQKRAIDTAVHILVDISGSMAGYKIKLATESCFAVAKALEPIRGVSLGISVFPAVSGDVAPLLRHGERLTTRLSVKAEGGTPLTEALYWVLQELGLREEPRKILLVLTDGLPADAGSAKAAFRMMDKLGIECLGIGIQSESMKQLLPESHRNIQMLDELAPAMFALLQPAMLGRGNAAG